MRRAFPVTGLLRLPDTCSPASLRFQHGSVSGLPLWCLRSCLPYADASHMQERLGSPKFFNASLPACHGLRTPADLHLLAHTAVRVWPSGAFKPSASATSHVEAVPALQGARSPLRPPGYSVDASPILFTISPRLRHGRKTRYGRMASPYPTGTFTLQDALSFI